MTPTGKGMFVWRIERIGSPLSIAIQAKAAGIPTAAEAWGMINRPRVHVVRYCEEGARLYQLAAGAIGADYMRAVGVYGRHLEACSECGESYEFEKLPPLVDRVARALGWPSCGKLVFSLIVRSTDISTALNPFPWTKDKMAYVSLLPVTPASAWSV